MKLTIDYETTPKRVPRVKYVNGQVITYYHWKTTEAIDNIRAILAEMSLNSFPPHTPLKLEVTFYRTKSKWLPKREALPFRKPDLDNLYKTIGDCLSYPKSCTSQNNIPFPPSIVPDDAQITTCVSKKRWSTNNHGYIEVELTEDTP
jgi:Holliday junction resolvase RusA-like endonuclease